MKKIVHIDADCFFAAVEMRENPQLAYQPIAVGGDANRRGVVATCNYEARRYGVRSAMASSVAKKLCPDLKILPPRMEEYRKVSKKMQAIFSEYSAQVEPMSLDEAYLDVTGSEKCFGSATLIAKEIKARVLSEVGVPVSAGVAPLKFLAKIASDWKKPDGLFVVSPQDVLPFVKKLPVEVLPGVGRVTAEKFHRYGIYSCEDVGAWGEVKLCRHFGQMGHRIWQMSNGIDRRLVVAKTRRKSLSVERTFEDDISSVKCLDEKLDKLMGELLLRHERLDADYRISKRFVKMKFADFTQTTVECPTTSMKPIFDRDSFARLMNVAWSRNKIPVRLLGAGFRLKDERSAPEQICLNFDQ